MNVRGLLLAGLLGCAGASHATVLLFEKDLGQGRQGITDTDLATYGDRVTATSQNTFSYGSANGFTPNVVVDYIPVSTGTQIAPWSFGYGDLEYVIWNNGNSTGENIGSVRLTADQGWFVTLHSLEAADWSNMAPPGAFLRVRNASGNLIYNWTGAFNTVTHDDFVFSNPLIDTTLTIEWNNGWHTALDNIAFGQTAVPEPATMGALALGAFALLRRRAKRSA